MVLRFLTAGESHGPALTVIVEGLPAGVPLRRDTIDRDLRRRMGGYGRGGRMKIEKDRVEVLSGIKKGVTLGSPLAFRVQGVKSQGGFARTGNARQNDQLSFGDLEFNGLEIMFPRTANQDVV